MDIEKVQKLVAKLRDKTEYFIHIINLKQALNHWLVLKKVHRLIKFNQSDWIKIRILILIDMNTDWIKKAKADF